MRKLLIFLPACLLLLFSGSADAYKTGFCTEMNSASGGPGNQPGVPIATVNNCTKTGSERGVLLTVPAAPRPAPQGSSRSLSWSLPQGTGASAIEFKTRTISMTGDWRLRISARVGGKVRILQSISTNSNWVKRSPAIGGNELLTSLTVTLECPNTRQSSCLRKRGLQAGIRDLALTIPDARKPALSLNEEGFDEGVNGRGEVSVSPAAFDGISGVKSVKVQLDGTEVTSLQGSCSPKRPDGLFPAFRPCPMDLEGTLTFDSRGFEDGDYELRVCAADAQGNSSCVKRQVGIRNLSLEDIEVFSDVSGSSVLLYWDVVEGATYSCSLESGSWSDCSSGGYEFQASEGKSSYRFQIKARRGTGPEFLTDTIIETDKGSQPVPLFPPVLDTDVYGGKITVYWPTGPYDDSYKCRLDDGAWKDCPTAEFSVKVPTDPRVFKVEVRVTDIWGQQASATVFFDQKGRLVNP